MMLSRNSPDDISHQRANSAHAWTTDSALWRNPRSQGSPPQQVVADERFHRDVEAFFSRLFGFPALPGSSGESSSPCPQRAVLARPRAVLEASMVRRVVGRYSRFQPSPDLFPPSSHCPQRAVLGCSEDDMVGGMLVGVRVSVKSVVQ